VGTPPDQSFKTPCSPTERERERVSEEREREKRERRE
jgi:hypothetical protein